jgi:hypothetical protein
MNNPFKSLVSIFKGGNKLAKNDQKPATNVPFNTDKSRLSARLKLRYQFRAPLEMDTWKAAILQAEDPNYPNRELLYSLYREVIRDRHLKGQINTRVKQVLCEEVVVIDKKTKEVDVALTELLQRPWYQQYSYHQLMAEFWGHSLIEFQRMVPSESGIVELEMSSVKLFPREHVKPEAGIIVVNPGDVSGIPFREKPFSEWLVEIGEEDNLGLLADACPEVIWKTYSRSDWSRRSEKFGMPIIIMKTEETDEKELDKKEEFLAELGTNGYAMLDKLDDFQLSESSMQDAYKIYQELANFCNKEMSKLLAGQTMTAEDGSSLSQAEVHKMILEIWKKADMIKKQFEDNYRLFPLLIQHGYPLQGKMLIYTSFLNKYRNPGVPETDPTQTDDANKKQRDPNDKADADQEPNGKKSGKADPKKEKAPTGKRKSELNFF